MIKVRLREIIDSTDVLRKLAGENLRGRTAFQISKLLKKLEEELDLFNKTRVEIIKKYGEKDDNGELKTDDNGNVKIVEESVNAFNQEMLDLLNQEIEINANPITLDDLENINFTPAEITTLMPFIQE